MEQVRPRCRLTACGPGDPRNWPRSPRRLRASLFRAPPLARGLPEKGMPGRATHRRHPGDIGTAILRAGVAGRARPAPARTAAFTAETGLFGHLPRDSIRWPSPGLLTEIEDRLGIVIEDDEVDGEMLETYGRAARLPSRPARAAKARSMIAAWPALTATNLLRRVRPERRERRLLVCHGTDRCREQPNCHFTVGAMCAGAGGPSVEIHRHGLASICEAKPRRQSTIISCSTKR